MNHEDLQKLLQSALSPMGDTQPRRDLWPAIRRRIESGSGHIFRFGPMDWAIAAVICAAILIFPGLIPEVLYHL